MNLWWWRKPVAKQPPVNKEINKNNANMVVRASKEAQR
jgi:hypothetical protein